MMYTMPKNLLSICVNFALATQQVLFGFDSLSLVFSVDSLSLAGSRLIEAA